MEQPGVLRNQIGSTPTYVNLEFLTRRMAPACQMPSSPPPARPATSNQEPNCRTLSSKKSEIWEVLFDYEANDEDELSLRCGQRIELLSTDVKISGDEGWWTGKIGEKVGIFPANFVEPIPPTRNGVLYKKCHKEAEPKVIHFDELQLEEVIGIGGFGKVYRG